MGKVSTKVTVRDEEWDEGQKVTFSQQKKTSCSI